MKKMIDHFSNPTLKITKQILECDLEEVCYKIENLRKKQSFINSEGKLLHLNLFYPVFN